MDRVVPGRVTVVCGPMYAGKTEELIRRIRRARIAGQYVEVFTPSTDTRFVGEIVSHGERKLDGVPVQVVPPGENLVRRVSLEVTKVVAIDEAQFFEETIVAHVRRLSDLGIHVIAGGLDLDYRAEPFGSMPKLLALADEVYKLTAVCVRCKGDATRTQRLTASTSQILIGAQEAYEARCRTCFKVPA